MSRLDTRDSSSLAIGADRVFGLAQHPSDVSVRKALRFDQAKRGVRNFLNPPELGHPLGLLNQLLNLTQKPRIDRRKLIGLLDRDSLSKSLGQKPGTLRPRDANALADRFLAFRGIRGQIEALQKSTPQLH